MGTGACKLFQSWFHSHCMHDLRFHGPRFTWSHGNLFKCLDRVICNGDWAQTYAASIVLHLPKFISDHRPLLVNENITPPRNLDSRPFRFQAAWLTNDGFKDFVANSWDRNVTYLEAANLFQVKVMEWNRQHFGNIFWRKRRLLARLGGIQRALEKYTSQGLLELELKLKTELEEVLIQEEIFWLQKSRKDWLLLGDRNTSYYHQKTLSRRRHNHITAIQNNAGSWIYDKEEIKAHVIQFYLSLYSCDSPHFRAYPHPHSFPFIDDDELQYLHGQVDDDKIKKTIFGMHPLKALGPDGLHAIFYQTQWDTVGSSLCCLMKEVFQHKRLPGDLNATLIALIPKIENPSSLKLYRPISLCNVAYKTITKIIANRLQSILPQLIGPHQTSFVSGRHITENIVIAQEVIHSMRKKTGAKGFMVIKVDLEKAYDRLSWEFINDTLCEARLPLDLIQVIMACITLVQMRVLWNGEVTNEFLPSRGIRQGDPLSLYLFILCIERLSHGIHNAVTAGKWKPIRLAHNGIPLSHLFFADDLLLGAAMAKISGLLGFSVTQDLGKDLGKYLGVPFHHTRVTNNMFQDIVDKVEKRLSGWNASHLSLAGRITLAQSVLQAIPIYVMQIVAIPAGIRERIDRACRRFIWSGSSPHQRLSMISWKDICKPKSAGGLGFKSLALMNRALHMKLAWGLISSPNSFWSEVQASRHWCLGDGHSVWFWWDFWVTRDVPLAAYTINNLPSNISNGKVADFVKEDSSWYWDRFEQFLPSHIILQIVALHPPSPDKGTDSLFWAHSKFGRFTTHSAYLALSNDTPMHDDRLWRMVWNWKGPQSVRIFLWQVFHDRLKTKAELARHHIPVSTSCDRCGAMIEDAMHVLRDCALQFFNSRLQEWLRMNVGIVGRLWSVSNWAIFFGIALWRLWFWRNHFIFNQASMDPNVVLMDVFTRTAEMHKIHTHPLTTGYIRVTRWISWKPPDWPWCSLNTDGAHNRGGISTAGGLIRDHMGCWLSGFGMMIGSCSITVAELWGLYQGLQLAWNSGKEASSGNR
ncbi:uncharacterized protein LOC127900258 [Citrus sinensis]|uniref:uncharacterized protein LOC127900258 n=1 Tax=Citrus sinensis TaxID=2711 RepID=UPI0022799409|nr:uncharacterized protein LOC127900258 [Citrus sinensis]